MCDWPCRRSSFFLWLQPHVQYVVGRVVLSRRVTVTGSLAVCLPPVPWLVGPFMPQLPMGSLVCRVCRKNKKTSPWTEAAVMNEAWGVRPHKWPRPEKSCWICGWDSGISIKMICMCCCFFLTGVYSQVCVLWFPTQNISTRSGKLWNLATLQVGEKELERETCPIIWKVHPPHLNVFIQYMLLEYCCSVYWILPY